MPVYTYITLDNSSQSTVATDAWGINGSGQIVGYYQPNFFGFLDNGGTHTTLNDSLGTHGTLEVRIKVTGQIVGYYEDDGTAFGLVTVTLGHHNRRC